MSACVCLFFRFIFTLQVSSVKVVARPLPGVVIYITLDLPFYLPPEQENISTAGVVFEQMMESNLLAHHAHWSSLCI